MQFLQKVSHGSPIPWQTFQGNNLYHRFDDPTKGTEFFKVKYIRRVKQPYVSLLENVKNLESNYKMFL